MTLPPASNVGHLHSQLPTRLRPELVSPSSTDASIEKPHIRREESLKSDNELEGPTLSSKIAPSETPPVTQDVMNTLVPLVTLSVLVFVVIGTIIFVYRRCIGTSKKSKEQTVSFIVLKKNFLNIQ